MSTIARKTAYVLLAAILVSTVPESRPAFAALPFLTDDAETVGKGTSQIELWYARSTDRETAEGSRVKTDENLPGATFGYGVADPLDLSLGFARRWGKDTVDGASTNDAGSAVFTLSAKWRFFEHAGFLFAVKPLVGYSYRLGGTGNDQAITGGGWFIVTREHEALEVSLNAGFLYIDYRSAAERVSSRSGIWTFSALATYELLEELKLGLDTGASTSGDKTSSGMSAYALAGVIYSPTRNVDLSLGFKIGLTSPEPDFAGTAGVTIRY